MPIITGEGHTMAKNVQSCSHRAFILLSCIPRVAFVFTIGDHRPRLAQNREWMKIFGMPKNGPMATRRLATVLSSCLHRPHRVSIVYPSCSHRMAFGIISMIFLGNLQPVATRMLHDGPRRQHDVSKPSCSHLVAIV